MTLYILVCLALAVIFGGAYYAYRIPFYSSAKRSDAPPTLTGTQYESHRAEISRLYHQLKDRPFESITIHSREGLALHGRYYHCADGAPLDIGFHGYRSSYVTDFAGGSELSFRMGHNLLLIDQRAHGKSEGRTITFGIKERQDLLCWVNYALDRFGKDTRILLYGVSMGAATVLMASELELPDNVKAIIADCPYSSPLDIILAVGKQTGYPPKLIRPFVILGAKIYGGFDVQQTSAREAVTHTRVPILIIHGEADSFVPAEMSRIIQEANPRMVTRYTIPGAEHAISYLVDTPTYHRIVTDFVNQVL